MMHSTMPSLIPLGSARQQTRAAEVGEKMELNPVFHYNDAGITRLGSAAAVTRADDRGTALELIPVGFWTPPGA